MQSQYVYVVVERCIRRRPFRRKVRVPSDDVLDRAQQLKLRFNANRVTIVGQGPSLWRWDPAELLHVRFALA